MFNHYSKLGLIRYLLQYKQKSGFLVIYLTNSGKEIIKRTSVHGTLCLIFPPQRSPSLPLEWGDKRPLEQGWCVGSLTCNLRETIPIKILNSRGKFMVLGEYLVLL